MNAEIRLKLNKFIPRSYQLPLIKALEEDKYKRIMAIWPRRAGKDILCFNLMIRAALRKVAVYYYIFPTYSQAKRVIYDAITNTGEKVLDYIPKELVASKNSQEMKITLTNGSIIQLVGSDNYDALMGTNPQGCIFSEYALQNPMAYQYIKPILTANHGWAIFISTPRGKNHLWELYQIALNSPEWYCTKLTVADTKHITLNDIERERAEGIMSEDLIQQEYNTSFSMGVEGAYYMKYLDKMRLNNRIGQVPYEIGFKVHTAWDIGTECTAIVFFQTVGTTVRIIDYYQNSRQGLEHYISVLDQKGYNYGKHIAPHDIAVKEWGSGITRIEKAKQLGVNFTLSANQSIEDGIEAVRTTFSKMYIDETNCKELLKVLENYRQEYDQKRKVYKGYPLKDWASHGADAMRYMAISLPKTQDGMTPQDLEHNYQKAMNVHNVNLPRFFQNPSF